MSNPPTQTTGLCSPSSVATFLPTADMTTEWCAVPQTSNTTSTVMQQCCGSRQVQLTGGCEWCYYEDSTAEDSVEFQQDFTACLQRGARRQNVSVVQTSYCNTPKLSSAASGDGVRGWGVWSVVALVGVSFALGGFF